MFNKNLKKKVAVLLTGVMVLGMTVTASAAGETSGSSEGTGNFEGHVNRKVVDVTLPTVAEGTTPFSFIMDNEGLIKETGKKAYGEDFTFNDDTYNVYFKTADKTFGKDSTVFSVSNNSSVSVNVTLKIDVTAGANDPELVGAVGDLPNDYNASTNPVSGDPSLFLGLVVAGDATAAGDTNGTYAISENSVSKTFNLAGTPENYEVSVNQVGEEGYPHDYQFVKKATLAANWKKVDFNLTGKANKVEDAEGITAPNLKVTWSFDAAGGGATELTGSYVSASDVYEFALPDGVALTAIGDVTNLKVNGVAISTAPTTNSTLTKVRIAKSAVKSALGDAWAGTTNLGFTFSAGGVNYKCDIAR